MRLRLAQYLKDEKHIAASDTGGIVERWRWGHRVLTNPKMVTPAGSLRNGIVDELIKSAASHGYKITHTEINRRIRCAKAYPTEAQILSVATEYGYWWALVSAGFPPVEVPEDVEDARPYDPRSSSERLRDAVDELKRIRERPEAHGQLALNLVFLPGITVDTYGPQSSLNDLWKAHEVIKTEVTPELGRAYRQAQRDDWERERTLQRMTDAVGGDRSATWEDASNAVRDE